MTGKRVKVKPGKAQSKMGFIVGLIFVGIGLFIAIPTFGLFGIFWTAIAGFIAYSHYKNGFTDEGFPTHEIIIDEEFVGQTSVTIPEPGEYTAYVVTDGGTYAGDFVVE